MRNCYIKGLSLEHSSADNLVVIVVVTTQHGILDIPSYHMPTTCQVTCQEYYLLALAQPRRDSRALGEDSAGSSPARSLSSALRPSFFRTAASSAKSSLNEAAQLDHGKTSTKPGFPPLQLSADSREVQTHNLNMSASAIPASVSLHSSSSAAAMHMPAGLPQETVTQAQGAGRPDGQAGCLEDPAHQDDQVYLLTKCLPGFA